MRSVDHQENPMFPATEYLTDAAQRALLFWDVMRERGNQYRERRKRPCGCALNRRAT